jgi:hypothetical protein
LDAKLTGKEQVKQKIALHLVMSQNPTQDLGPFMKDCELSVHGFNKGYIYVCGLGLAAAKAEPGLLLMVLTDRYRCSQNFSTHLLAKAEAMASADSLWGVCLWSCRSSNADHALIIGRLINVAPVSR